MNALLAILNVFFNPAETVRRTKGSTLGWLAPILLGGLIFGAYNHTLPRAGMQALRNQPPEGVTQKQLDDQVGTMEKMARFATITAPLYFAIMTMLASVLVFSMCILLRVNLRFPDLYNLMAHIGLINALQALWHLHLLLEKGVNVTAPDLLPSFGLLQSQLAADAPKYLQGLAAYFSVFALWNIVALTLGVAALGKTSPFRAFVATAPSWLLFLIFAVVVTMARQ